MSLESFIGFESGEPMSSAALEKLQERMRAAAAQIAAIRREEKKHKQKEDELVKILLKFIRSSHKSELVLLVSRALEQDIPANFVLAVILLGNKDIQQEVGTKFLLPKIEDQKMLEADNSSGIKLSDPADAKKNLIFFTGRDETLPLAIKVELDTWVKSLILQAEENTHKLIKNAYKIEYIEEENDDHGYFSERKVQEKKSVKKILIQLISFVINDYLAQNGINDDFSKILDFSEFIVKGILSRIENMLENQKLLGSLND